MHLACWKVAFCTFFLVSKSEHKSCTKPTDALRESKVIGPLHILSSCKHNTFWYKQFLQWVGGQLETLSKKLFTYKNSPDFRWLQNLMRPPDVCNLLFFFSISSPCHRWIHRFHSPCLAWRWNWSFFLAIAKTKFLNSSQMRRRLVSWFWVHGGLVKRKKLTRWIVDFPTFLAWCPWSGRTNHFFPHFFPRFNASRHKIRFPMWPTLDC